jgi:hypothetical protein
MIGAANYLATETLRDGRSITIRAQRPEDLDGWRAALARTSVETLYHRFFAVKREISEKEAHFFLTSTSSSASLWSRSRMKTGARP